MIVSMTGYGEAAIAEEGVGYSVEVRSVNHRYFKASIKLPDSLQFLEDRVERWLREELQRGSVFYQLRTHNDAQDAAAVNLRVLQSYVDQLARAQAPAGVELRIDLGALSALPGVCEPPLPDERTSERRAAIVERLTREALGKLLKMREEEGAALYRELSAHCEAMRRQLALVRQRAPQVVEDYRDRLSARVERLIQDARIELDADTLCREVALYADRCDISEEVARLDSHLDQFLQACRNESHVGRKLDFLSQEMLREVNTIGSKSADVALSMCAVELKSLIDRLKEQVQNVE